MGSVDWVWGSTNRTSCCRLQVCNDVRDHHEQTVLTDNIEAAIGPKHFGNRNRTLGRLVLLQQRNHNA